jgi:Zn-dependent protease with chaperone function
MSELPPVSPKGGDAAELSSDDRFRQGLVALQRQDYTLAMEYFAMVARDLSTSQTMRLKARMGMVKALFGADQVEQAIALTEKLVTHPQPKVQQWAQDTLTTLRDRSSLSSAKVADKAPDVTGFQPLAPDERPAPVPARRSFLPSPAVVDESSEPHSPTTEVTGDTNPAADSSAEAMPPEGHLSSDSSTELENVEFNPDLATIAPPHQPFHPATVADSSTQAIEPPTVPESRAISFQTGDRLERLRSLPKKAGELLTVWGTQLLAVIAVFLLSRTLIRWSLIQFSELIEPLSRFLPVSGGWGYRPQTGITTLLLGGLLLASPWLLDWLLQQKHHLKPLSIATLKSTHPESCRLLRRISQERGWQLPALHILPSQAPLIFSYGWLPRLGRIVISQGALTLLADDELATLMGYELAQFTRWTLPFLSWVAVLLQLLYLGYWQTAQWGDQARDRASKTLFAVPCALCYALYWLLRKLMLLPLRLQVLGCDRQAVEWTGNPNGLVRALIKLQSGIADEIAQRGNLPPLVESTDLLTPCGYESAITLGSLFPDPAFTQALAWDVENPYRRWLSFNSSHPLLGDRLKKINRYGLHWHLTPDFPVPASLTQPSNNQSLNHYWFPFLQQMSPYLGPVIGVGTALLLWFLSGVLTPLGVPRLGSFYGDTAILRASLFLGLGAGIMLRLNRYFPDISVRDRMDAPSLAQLLSNPLALPTDSRPVRLEGTLLGRRGMANWFCQDLILKTPTGLLKLHFLSTLGAFGNYLIHPQHPTDWLGKVVTVQGWFRKGAIAWLDIDQILQKGKLQTRAHHPIWSTILSLSFCLLGFWTLLRG